MYLVFIIFTRDKPMVSDVNCFTISRIGPNDATQGCSNEVECKMVKFEVTCYSFMEGLSCLLNFDFLLSILDFRLGALEYSLFNFLVWKFFRSNYTNDHLSYLFVTL
jgi:hypothetical protein